MRMDRHNLVSRVADALAGCASVRFKKLMIQWGLLLVGHVVGLSLYCGLPTDYASVWHVAALPISAIVYAAIGPLSIILFLLILFRVQGGTATAILSLLCGVPLLYWFLLWLVRKQLKAECCLHRWLISIVLVCYSALSSFALLYGCSSI